MKRAEGGRDPENIEEAKLRARREVRSQQRAVTAEDYEDLTIQASREVARVRSVTPDKDQGLPPGMIDILLVPAVFESVRLGDYHKLVVPQQLARDVETHLNQYRLLTTTLRIREPNYIGIKVNAEIVINEYSDPEVVRDRVNQSLRNFLSPLAVGGSDDEQDELLGPNWKGWPFGRALFISELFTLIQRVPGVKHVLDVKISQRTVVPNTEIPLRDVDERAVVAAERAEPPPLVLVDKRRLDVPADTLLCSLTHEITLAEL